MLDLSKAYYIIVPWSFDWWLPLIVSCVAHFFVFWVAWFRKDNAIVDVQWGLSYIYGNLAILIVRTQHDGVVDARVVILNVLVAIWGLRMTIHVALRTKKGQEDRRFVVIREQVTEKAGIVVFFCFSLFGIWMGNALFINIINGSALYISMYSTALYPLSYLDFLGILIWAIGFTILTVSDHQVRLFKNKRDRNETNGERLCKTGMWKYSMHPNYFGEALLWWGIYLMACAVEGGWRTLWAPLLINVMLRFVSGVPLIEELYKDDAEFAEWKSKTNVFVPWRPKITHVDAADEKN
jgi:steroid 5-alpha reductase family enzyme